LSDDGSPQPYSRFRRRGKQLSFFTFWSFQLAHFV
jgi:hypothetical protein